MSTSNLNSFLWGGGGKGRLEGVNGARSKQEGREERVEARIPKLGGIGKNEEKFTTL